MRFLSALVVASIAALAASPAHSGDERVKPDDLKKGTFVCRIGGQEVGREEFEVRDDGWWAKGTFDLFGQMKGRYEFTRKNDGKKAVFDAKVVNNDEPVDFTATLEGEKFDLVAQVKGEEKKASVDLAGKTSVVPFVNLVWIFFVDIGRELVTLAEAGKLAPGTTLHTVDIGAARAFPTSVEEVSVVQRPFGGESVTCFQFRLKIAGSVEALVLTTQKGFPLYFLTPSQKLDVVVLGYESLAVEPEPRTIVDAGPWRAALSKPEHAVVVEKGVKVPMRDGVKLAADVFRPEKPGKYATVLARTPYGRGSEGLTKGYYYASRGYVVVAQDVRGRGDSEGAFRPAFNEANDGSDTLDWIAAQPWSDGGVGMIGGSYVAWVQWLVAATGNPHLKAIIPQVSPPDPHENIPYEGGVFCLSSAWWAVAAEAIAKGKGLTDNKIDWLKAMSTLPLTDLDTALGLESSAFLDEWISHPQEDPYWEPLRYQQRFASMDVPALHISGWFDGDQPGAPMNFAGMRKSAKSERARNGQILVMGAWSHAFNTQSQYGDFDFGRDAIVDLDALQLRFFDRWLKGVENGIENEDPVFVFSMFDNAWHREKDWPLPQTKWTELHLGGSGKANKRDGGGTLGLAATESPADRFVYDPLDIEDIKVDFNDTSGDLLSVDAYKDGDDEDVLDYFSPPLGAPAEIIGPISVVLSVSTDAPDTDFSAVLLRVDESGKATAVRWGVQRLSYRKGWNAPSLAKPGSVSTVTIDLWATGIRYGKGERIGVMVLSSLYPGFARHLNTVEPAATAKKAVVANQTVFHDKARPSYVLLPVIPRDGAPGISFAAER